MGKNRKLSIQEFQFLYSYEPYTQNRSQQQKQKLNLLSKVITAYGDTYYNLKDKTRQVIEMVCWFSAEKGYCFAKEDYFSDRFGLAPRTVRNIFKQLRDAGVILTVHRHSTTQNGLGSAIHIFMDHPYFHIWNSAFELVKCQAECQAKNSEIPCESKGEEQKKVSTKNLSISKNLLKILRKKNGLDETYIPENIPQEFISAVKPFFRTAEEVYHLWGRVVISYKQSSLKNPVEFYQKKAVESFKQAVFAYKNRLIKKDFSGYFYGILKNKFSQQKAEETFETHPILYNWLEEDMKRDQNISPANENSSWREEIQRLMQRDEQALSIQEKAYLPY
ncbi:helix-turn-helix domain-containing protein [Domibacillus indicus]|uniref:helix-turn-helix domain-containing protein n=1 Tax=Domibacillus indicus TaxID=1437523 RepID=UPI000617CD35|nr:helix-turn-helix domain-containing protein [Domibacillus indicus]